MKRNLLKPVLTVVVLFIAFNLFALPDVPGDAGGQSVPLDGGLLLALFGGGSLVAALFKKNKKKED